MPIPIIGGDAQEGASIESQPLNFTSTSGIAAVLVGIGGAVPSIYELWGDLPNNVVVAGLGMVGAAAIAFAIASAGDALARGYSSAWVSPREGDKAARPAVLALAEAYAKAHETPEPATDKVFVPSGGNLVVHTVDSRDLRVILFEVTPGTGRLRYLVAGADKKASWVDAEDATAAGTP